MKSPRHNLDAADGQRSDCNANPVENRPARERSPALFVDTTFEDRYPEAEPDKKLRTESMTLAFLLKERKEMLKKIKMLSLENEHLKSLLNHPSAPH